MLFYEKRGKPERNNSLLAARLCGLSAYGLSTDMYIFMKNIRKLQHRDNARHLTTRSAFVEEAKEKKKKRE